MDQDTHVVLQRKPRDPRHSVHISHKLSYQAEGAHDLNGMMEIAVFMQIWCKVRMRMTEFFSI